jgi:class 3 adenylate cyclase
VTVELPSGTVTFLFTDIEDSTRRWEQEPAAMSAALARHDDLLVQAVSVNRGVVFAKGGDGMAVVFGRTGTPSPPSSRRNGRSRSSRGRRRCACG